MPGTSNLKSLSWYVAIALIGLMGLIRFWGLDASPPGFFMDEAYVGAHVICLAHTGHDADGRAWPLFSPSGGGGYASPTHLYPAALWVRCVGGSIVALRAYAALTMSLAIAGIFFLARRLMGLRGAVYALLAASLSPFLFQFSRMAFDDPATFLLGLTWGMYFFVRSSKWPDVLLSALFLSVSAYAYPSGRIVLPPVVGILAWLKWKRGELRPLTVWIFLAAAVVLCVPLAIQTLHGGLMARYDAVGLFSTQYRQSHNLQGPAVWVAFARNYLLHFGPNYLLFHGDENLRHNSGFSGELNWLDIAALLLGIVFFIAAKAQDREKPKLNPVFVFCIVGFVLGVLPAALTWEGVPHSLRSAASWPFVALLTGWIIVTLEPQWRWSAPLLTVAGAAFAVSFLYYYFAIYPTQAEPYFQSLVKDAAEDAQKNGDWDKFRTAAIEEAYDEHACRYFLMEYGGLNCETARQFHLTNRPIGLSAISK